MIADVHMWNYKTACIQEVPGRISGLALGTGIVLPCQASIGYMRNFKTAYTQEVPGRISGPVLGTGIVLLCQAPIGYMRNFKQEEKRWNY